MKPLPRHAALTLALMGNRLRANSSGAAAIASADPALWREVIAFASAHFVLPAIAESAMQLSSKRGTIPEDAAVFLSACAAANRARNRMLLDTLGSTGAALGAIGVSPIALKGAAFLAEDTTQDCAAWRFMQDIDILVPAERLKACVEALCNLGFEPATQSYDPTREAHYPPLISPCGTFSIEVHTRLFAFADHELDTTLVRAGAQPSRNLGSSILVPSPRHRLMHALAHAQLHNRNFARRRIVLKDLLDLNALEQAYGLLDPGFTDPHHRAAAEALLAALSLVRGDDSVRSLQPRRWARQALARLSWSKWRRLAATPLDVLVLESYRLRREPGHVKRRLGLMVCKERRSVALSAWLTKQRQFLWQ